MKKTILWLIQSNQVTPTILDFLDINRERLKALVHLEFLVPDSSREMMDKIGKLNPKRFQTRMGKAQSSFQAFLAKKEALQETKFDRGLSVSDVLLLDDLGGGNVLQLVPDLEPYKGAGAVVVQIPTPLGSSDAEEKVFQAVIVWARQNRIPVIGYELLPLDTRWTLTASLVDAVVVRSLESAVHLRQQGLSAPVRIMPLYEATLFSPIPGAFHISGLKAAYHYRNRYNIPAERTILYIPHNVAMIYEYRILMQIIQPMASHLHLMFGFGRDQVRGSHTQQELIKTVCENELSKFASHSFHDLASPWEMLLADRVLACAACFQTSLAEDLKLRSLIYDPLLPKEAHPQKIRTPLPEDILEELDALVKQKQQVREFGDTIVQIAKGK